MELKKTEDSNSIAENIEFDSAGNLTSVNYHDAKVCPIEESRATSPLCGFFYCQICKLLLTVPLNPSRLAVVCSRCYEATPIKTPPSDKCFYRCVCNCLLLISRLQNVFFCPRRSCHSVLITEYAKRHPKLISNFIQKHAKELKRFASLPNISALNENSQIGAKDWSTVLIRCGYCKKIFKAKPYLDLSAEIVCPKCENVSALTPRYPRRVCRSYILYGLLTILVSSAVSLGTYTQRERNHGIFCLTVVQKLKPSLLGLFVIGAALILQALLYCTMTISTIISGAARID